MKAVPQKVREQIIALRVQQRLSLRDIAKCVGLGATTCARILKKYPLTKTERATIWQTKVAGRKRTADGRLESGPDLTDKRFGRLIALHREFSDGTGARWLCVCDCGNETIVRVDSLRRGTTASCGCLARDLVRQREQKDPDSVNLNSLFLGYKHSAKNRGIPFELSKGEFESFLHKNCSYCGVPPSHVRRVHANQVGDRDKPYVYNGIDRIDSTIGYALANCTTCCTDCNVAKGSRGQAAFLAWIKRLVEFQTKDGEAS